MDFLLPRALEKHGKPLAQGDTGMVKSNLAKLMKEKKLLLAQTVERHVFLIGQF